MKDERSPEDVHATNDYLKIQDFIYGIANEYLPDGRYGFFIMLAGEMFHNAINAGKKIKLDELAVFKEFSEELDRHTETQKSVNEANYWIKRWERETDS